MSVENFTPETLKQTISSGELTLVDFWADWCMPCKSLAPVLDSLAQKYEGAIKVGKVNVAQNQAVGVEHSITNIPCLVVFQGGREVDRMIGFKGEKTLETLFVKYTKGS